MAKSRKKKSPAKAKKSAKTKKPAKAKAKPKAKAKAKPAKAKAKAKPAKAKPAKPAKAKPAEAAEAEEAESAESGTEATPSDDPVETEVARLLAAYHGGQIDNAWDVISEVHELSEKLPKTSPQHEAFKKMRFELEDICRESSS